MACLAKRLACLARRSALQVAVGRRRSPCVVLRALGGVRGAAGVRGALFHSLPDPKFEKNLSLLSGDEKVEYWGRLEPTSVTLRDLCEIGLDKDRRRAHGVFLHRELRIRFAQRVLELQALPHGLAEREGVQNVIRWYTEFVCDLEDAQVPETPEQDEEFTNLLMRIFEEHTEVIQELAFGVQDLMAELGPDYETVQPQVDTVLRRFFMARIGLRFLLQHHIESRSNRDGHSGILQLNCNVMELASKCAKDSSKLCRAHLGQAPQIVVDEFPKGKNHTLTYVPMHLNYMLNEVFKNACRATVELHADGFDDALPVVRCRIVHGNEDVTIKVTDEGGGISRRRMQDVWKFMYSTYRQTPWAALRMRARPRPSQGDAEARTTARGAPGVLAGYGVGLTLSRLYAQYFGGDMKIRSMDGYGTDVYMHIHRLGQNCENLPEGVLSSPSMSDSSPLEDSAMQERMLISADEEAFLRRELLAFRKTLKSTSDGSITDPSW